jgi:hypothetical protein
VIRHAYSSAGGSPRPDLANPSRTCRCADATAFNTSRAGCEPQRTRSAVAFKSSSSRLVSRCQRFAGPRPSDDGVSSAAARLHLAGSVQPWQHPAPRLLLALPTTAPRKLIGEEHHSLRTHFRVEGPPNYGTRRESRCTVEHAVADERLAGRLGTTLTRIQIARWLTRSCCRCRETRAATGPLTLSRQGR